MYTLHTKSTAISTRILEMNIMTVNTSMVIIYWLTSDVHVAIVFSGSTVFYPADAVSTERAVELAANTKGVCFIRTSRPNTAVIYKNDELFKVVCQFYQNCNYVGRLNPKVYCRQVLLLKLISC